MALSASAAPSSRRSKPPLIKGDEVSIQELMKLLLLRLSRDVPDSYSHDPVSEEILLDMDVEGRRYVLVRMRADEGSILCLSPREQEIVRMVAKGYPNKIIADVLNISSWTVCTHLRRVFAKLGVGSRTAMLARLVQDGWVWENAARQSNPHVLNGQREDANAAEDRTSVMQKRRAAERV